MIRRLALLLTVACGTSTDVYKPGKPLTVDVASVFPAGTNVRDAYGGATVTVASNGTVTVTPDANGVVLLEKDGSQPSAFDWRAATVYFVITDRFFNGNTANDHSYGRAGDGAQEIGTWHGGDLAGLTAKLDYIRDLGATAIWISPAVEQVHGWVGGGNGDFKYYGYHGYWALDFTRLDANFGTEAEMQAFVDGAHQRGIRVLLDVVLNHPGYATGDDLVAYLPSVFKDGTGDAFKAFSPHAGQTWLSWNDLVNYTSPNWPQWWTPKWIRAGLGPSGLYDPGGQDSLTQSLTFLPDFKTESTGVADVPPFLAAKNGMTDLGLTVRQYLVKWQSDWVAKFGFDGFRCDTAKNVENGSWAALKNAATPALQAWKAANPSKKIDDAPFWMTGEVYGHGVQKDAYFSDAKFDSLINFDFQGAIRDLLATYGSLAGGSSTLESLYAGYAGQISSDPTFDVLSYLSSHDTRLFFGDIAKYDAGVQRQAGTALFLAPGGIQVFYGDESGRRLGPAGSDAVQGTRSDMNWSSIDPSILQHFTRLGAFRKKHAAVGAGAHAKLTSPGNTYAFSRKTADDAVVVVVTTPAG